MEKPKENASPLGLLMKRLRKQGPPAQFQYTIINISIYTLDIINSQLMTINRK